MSSDDWALGWIMEGRLYGSTEVYRSEFTTQKDKGMESDKAARALGDIVVLLKEILTWVNNPKTAIDHVPGHVITSCVGDRDNPNIWWCHTCGLGSINGVDWRS